MTSKYTKNQDSVLPTVDTGREAWLLTLGRDRSGVGLMENVTSETPFRNGKNVSRPDKEGHGFPEKEQNTGICTEHLQIHVTQAAGRTGCVMGEGGLCFIRITADVMKCLVSARYWPKYFS